MDLRDENIELKLDNIKKSTENMESVIKDLSANVDIIKNRSDTKWTIALMLTLFAGMFYFIWTVSDGVRNDITEVKREVYQIQADLKNITEKIGVFSGLSKLPQTIIELFQKIRQGNQQKLDNNKLPDPPSE